ASGTAGFARSLVSGNKRVPCPPPIITESTLLVLTDWRPDCDITNPVLFSRLRDYTCWSEPDARSFGSRTFGVEARGARAAISKPQRVFPVGQTPRCSR